MRTLPMGYFSRSSILPSKSDAALYRRTWHQLVGAVSKARYVPRAYLYGANSRTLRRRSTPAGAHCDTSPLAFGGGLVWVLVCVALHRVLAVGALPQLADRGGPGLRNRYIHAPLPLPDRRCYVHWCGTTPRGRVCGQNEKRNEKEGGEPPFSCTMRLSRWRTLCRPPQDRAKSFVLFGRPDDCAQLPFCERSTFIVLRGRPQSSS